MTTKATVLGFASVEATNRPSGSPCFSRFSGCVSRRNARSPPKKKDIESNPFRSEIQTTDSTLLGWKAQKDVRMIAAHTEQPSSLKILNSRKQDAENNRRLVALGNAGDPFPSSASN